MLFSRIVLLCGAPDLTCEANTGRAVDAAKRAYDGISGDGCEVDSLAGLIQGNLQAAIPYCVYVKVITETVTSTSTRTKVVTKTTTVAGDIKLKARAAEVTPAAEVLGRRDEKAVDALAHLLQKCPESAVSVACTGGSNQRAMTTTTTTTTTALNSTTVTSTRTVTKTVYPFRIYSESSIGRKRSAQGQGPSKQYLMQSFQAPYAVYPTDDVNEAVVFNYQLEYPG